jgi:glycosyltransferase involved in cell wall biosynthesis
MNVAILADQGNADGTVGGAELTMREFAACCPKEITLTDLEHAETVIVSNCVGFPSSTIRDLVGKRVIRYFNDLDPHSDRELQAWLIDNAELVFTSPLHREKMGLEGDVIPPALDLSRFKVKRKGRAGAVSVGAWQNPGKGQQLLREWADLNEPVDVYGTGRFTPHGPNLNVMGPVEYEQVPGVLARYKTFVHLPTALEPFGRAVVEAWASGCDLVINGNVGARYWIEEDPQGLRDAGERFWGLVGAVTA